MFRVCAYWIPGLLTLDQKANRVAAVNSEFSRIRWPKMIIILPNWQELAKFGFDMSNKF